MNEKRINIIVPNWIVPSNIRARSTLRYGPESKGFSKIPYDRFNLAMHVEDDDDAVMQNRQMLRESLNIPSEPCWLSQSHSTDILELENQQIGAEADASFTRQKGLVCVVMTADCLPILLCDRHGTIVAAIHAGWRGLLNGIIPDTLAAMGVPGSDMIAWLGPAIGPEAFEVGDDVRDSLVDADYRNSLAFLRRPESKWLANIYKLAQIQLIEGGVNDISGGTWCTYLNQENFFSYRRDGKTGRMASLIWLE